MYKLIGTNSVKRLADGAYIPFADGNRDYEDYKLWLEEGNTPEPEFTEEEIVAMEIVKQVAEAKAFLDKTDKKIAPYYEFEEGDNTLEWYIAERSKVRKFVRENS